MEHQKDVPEQSGVVGVGGGQIVSFEDALVLVREAYQRDIDQAFKDLRRFETGGTGDALSSPIATKRPAVGQPFSSCPKEESASTPKTNPLEPLRIAQPRVQVKKVDTSDQQVSKNSFVQPPVAPPALDVAQEPVEAIPLMELPGESNRYSDATIGGFEDIMPVEPLYSSSQAKGSRMKSSQPLTPAWQGISFSAGSSSESTARFQPSKMAKDRMASLGPGRQSIFMLRSASAANQLSTQLSTQISSRMGRLSSERSSIETAESSKRVDLVYSSRGGRPSVAASRGRSSLHASAIQKEPTQRRSSVAAQMAIKREAVFADAAAMKEKVRQAIGTPVYNVFDFYHTTGCWQKIARSSIFEHVTLGVIAANAIWIAVDTDENKAATLADADLIFKVVENLFCVYFLGEWIVRFMAFKNKFDGLRDSWFVFDSALVVMMVLETWLMTVVMLIIGGGSSSGFGNASILKLFRLLRLSRMARMARLLRAMPELMIMCKGMKVAMRSVFFTLCLLAVIVYIFAITLTQVLEDTSIGDESFRTVGRSMNSLLLHATIPDQADIVTAVGEEHFVFRIIILLYILFASLTVMNMLVGVLVEVVSIVSAVEKETMLVNFVKQQLQPMLTKGGLELHSGNTIGKQDFAKLLEQPEAARALQEVGVDVVGLVDFTDFIFQNGKELSFSDCMDLVLQLRGTNTATVKDVVDLRKHVMTELMRLDERNTERFALLLDSVEGTDVVDEKLKELDRKTVDIGRKH